MNKEAKGLFILQKMEENINKKENRIGLIILLILCMAFLSLLIYLLIDLNFLPNKFLIPIIVFLVILVLALFFFAFRKKAKKKTKRILKIFIVLLLLGMIASSYFVGRAIVFMDRLSNEDTSSNDYYILVLEGSSLLPEREVEELSRKEKLLNFIYKEKDDGKDKPYILTRKNLKSLINEKEIGTVILKDDAYSLAKGMIKNEANPIFKYEEDEKILYEKLVNKTYDYILISASTYEILDYEMHDLERKTDILYIEKIIKEEEKEEDIDMLKDSYNILLSGSDFYGTFASDTIHRSDVDMIVTVNPRTNSVHLTAIPRDYYVKLHSYGEYDKLTHASLKGMDELVYTIEDTFDIDINYYIRVNFNAVVQFIDVIGGIDIISEKEFYAITLPGEYGHFYEGENHLNGEQALAFARERYSFMDGSTSSGSEGDLQRIRNQQIILEAVLSKATSSSTILSNYMDILDTLGRKIETDIPTDDISRIVKNQLGSMPKWNITKYAINSDFGWEICYLAPYYGDLCVCYQDETENAYVRDEIIRVMSEDK